MGLLPCCGGPVALVVWWGYDAPQKLHEATTAEYAPNAVPALSAFLGGLRGIRGRGVHLSVVSHSYGSVLAGLAARTRRLAVDDLIITGSPGIPADYVSELHVPRVWASRATFDVLAGIRGWFGRNPVDRRFGARVFDAGSGDGLLPKQTHISYFREGSPALRSIALITAGRGDEVSVRHHRDGRLHGDAIAAHGDDGRVRSRRLPPSTAMCAHGAAHIARPSE